ncbi:indolepyruvate oxidoreductase subunit beta family protein [Humibacillus xanthopallidus]|uniref:indolepyruvate oxidoreductase subunit beta family protein n=1 Tax=Humibacillus xanthopallidus TaxID=412689 RepID=UPI0038502613
MSWTDGQRPITVAVLAMGGEGGGVLSNWIASLGEADGWTSQSTSVAGVAQRTGATIYYIELFPPHEDTGTGARQEPVLSMMPTPGEVDVVIASELMEAGRAVQRGFVTPDRTTLIASTNRVYSITERSTLGDGRVDSDALISGAGAASRRFVGADFMALALAARSVISASLFGALAASGTLPFSREDFEAAITQTGKAKQADASLRAFAAGFEAARTALEPPRAGATPDGTPLAVESEELVDRPRNPVPVMLSLRRPADPAEEAARAEAAARSQAIADPTSLVGPELHAHALRVARDFPDAARLMLLRGIQRTALYQDLDYTDRYLARVARIAALDPDRDGEAAMTTEAARHVALWMCYHDTIHVALQKTRQERLQRVRAEAGAAPEQLMQVREFLHPQVDEITDTMPTALGARLAKSKAFGKVVHAVAHKGIVVNTTSASGYTTLSVLARLRPMRPRSLRFGREQQFIDVWLDLAAELAGEDPDLGTEVIRCERVLKGYGQTHEHGRESFGLLMEAAKRLRGQDGAARQLARLMEAALVDEDGVALRTGLANAGLR